MRNDGPAESLPRGSHRSALVGPACLVPQGVRAGSQGSTESKLCSQIQDETSTFMAHADHTLSGSGGPTVEGPSVRSSASPDVHGAVPSADVHRKSELFTRILGLLHRKDAVIAQRHTILRQPAPIQPQPSVVLACAKCDFDYTVTRIVVGGRTAFVWTCECGSRFIPPGGPESFSLVRP